MLCSLSTKNLPTMQFMPLIITSQCDLSVKIANALSCVCQEFLSSAEQLSCQVLASAWHTPCIRSSMPHSDSGLAKCVLVLTSSLSLTFCGLMFLQQRVDPSPTVTISTSPSSLQQFPVPTPSKCQSMSVSQRKCLGS